LNKAKALVFFLPDFGLSAKHFAGVFCDKNYTTYSFDRRGFGMSQGVRGLITTDNRAFRDHWDFFDACALITGIPENIPKILISHGIGSLYGI
jgi:alpha-beta hydrolase superfamily lysophospholipase